LTSFHLCVDSKDPGRPYSVERGRGRSLRWNVINTLWSKETMASHSKKDNAELSTLLMQPIRYSLMSFCVALMHIIIYSEKYHSDQQHYVLQK